MIQEVYMDKLDLRRQYKSFYSPSAKEFSMVTLPPLPYLMIDGHGHEIIQIPARKVVLIVSRPAAAVIPEKSPVPRTTPDSSGLIYCDIRNQPAGGTVGKIMFPGVIGLGIDEKPLF